MEALSIVSGGTLGGFGSGGAGNWLAGMLHFSEGTPYVPRTGFHHLDQGEMVVPAHMNPNNPANSNSLGGGGGGDTHHHWGGVHIDTGGRELDPDMLAAAMKKAMKGGHFNSR